MSCSRLAGLGWRTGSLVLIRTSCSCLRRNFLILVCTSCSCLTFGRFVLSGLVLGSFVGSSFVGNSFVLGHRSLVGCSCLSSRYHALATKLTRLRSCSDCRPTVIHGRQKRTIAARRMRVLGLHCGCRRVSRACRGFFRGCRACGNSATAAVVADVVYPGFVDHGFVIDIGNVYATDVIHRGVIEEASVIPISAAVAYATVAETVVDTTVEADGLAPVAFIPGEGVAAPAPIAGSPEQARFRRLDPGARHPEVAFIAIRPVAGRPHIAGGWNHGLGVYRQRGRSDRDRHAELREQTGRYGHHQNC